MSTEPHHSVHAAGDGPRHADVSFEERDIKASTIYGYMLALGLTTVAALVISLFVWRFTSHLAASSDAPPPPSRVALDPASRMPPEPRLQGVPGHLNDPQKDLREKQKADQEANEKWEWIDKNAGMAQIPVREAMKLIAQKGLAVANPGPPAESKP